jgi:LPXTG-motif cell wall-anchored protein
MASSAKRIELQVKQSRRRRMMMRKLLLFASMAGVLMWLPSTAVAQTIVDQPVYLTFSGPVSVPGQTLAAGKYMFKMTSSKVDRQIVQIFDESGKSVAIVTAIGAARTNGEPVPEKPEVNFYEASPGVAQPVRMWWYPGIRTGGHEFIYPRAQAQQIAKTSTTGVLTTTGADVDSGKVVRMTPNGDTDATQNTEAPAAGASAAAMAPPEPATPPAPSAPVVSSNARSADMQARAATPARAARRALPKTASDLPILLAIGLISLFAGVALVARRRLA